MYKITATNTTGLLGKRSTCVPKVCIRDKETTSFVHYGKFDSRQHLRAAERQRYIQFIGNQDLTHTQNFIKPAQQAQLPKKQHLNTEICHTE